MQGNKKRKYTLPIYIIEEVAYTYVKTNDFSYSTYPTATLIIVR